MTAEGESAAQWLARFAECVREVCRTAGAKSPRLSGWTAIASNALLNVGLRLAPPNCDHACRGKPSTHGRSEHLSLDVLVYERNMGPIVFAAEHENTAGAADILSYQLWKLLNVRAKHRLLVGYWHAKTADPDPFATVFNHLSRVALRLPSGRVIVIMGPHTIRSVLAFDPSALRCGVIVAGARDGA